MTAYTYESKSSSCLTALSPTPAHAEPKKEEKVRNGATTHKPKRIHRQCRYSMRQHSPSEHAQIPGADPQIPHKVTASKCLHEAERSCVSPNTFLPAHGCPLPVHAHHPQRQHTHPHALNEGHDMYVPGQAGTAAELGVCRWKEEGREPGRDVGLDEGIAKGGKQHFVDVLWEGR